MELFGCFLFLLLLVASVASVAFWVRYLLFSSSSSCSCCCCPESWKQLNSRKHGHLNDLLELARSILNIDRKMVLTNIAKEHIEVWKEKWCKMMWRGELWRKPKTNPPQEQTQNKVRILSIYLNSQESEMNLPAVEMDKLSGARYDSPSGQERWVLSIAVSHPQFDEHLAKGQSTIPIVCLLFSRELAGLWNRLWFCGCRKFLPRPIDLFSCRRTLANTSACCKDGGGPTQVGISWGLKVGKTTKFNCIIFVAPLTNICRLGKWLDSYFFFLVVTWISFVVIRMENVWPGGGRELFKSLLWLLAWDGWSSWSTRATWCL